MKTTTIYAFAICLLLITSWACNNDKKVEQDLESTTTSERASLCGLEGYPHGLPDTLAQKDLKRYDEYYNTLVDILPPAESKHLSLGAEVVNIQELFEIVCAIKDDPTSSLYVMNAIKEVKNDDGKIISTETDMVFVVVPTNTESESVSEPESEPLPNSYFDFTSPCPAACPTVEGITYPDTPSN